MSVFNYLHWRQTLLDCKHALKSPLIWVDERGVQIPGYSDPVDSLLLT